MKSDPTVFVIDDDDSVYSLIAELTKAEKLHAEKFHSAEEFLAAFDHERPGCLVIDVRLPGISGLDLQQRIAEMGYTIPVIMLTGHADVSMAVEAMKAGAVSFLEKPIKFPQLLDAILAAMKIDATNRKENATSQEVRLRMACLTPRERDVMNLLIDGNRNKEVAAKLNISEKTVEVHRANLMKKLEVDTTVQLVRLAVMVGVIPRRIGLS